MKIEIQIDTHKETEIESALVDFLKELEEKHPNFFFTYRAEYSEK